LLEGGFFSEVDFEEAVSYIVWTLIIILVVNVPHQIGDFTSQGRLPLIEKAQHILLG